VRPNPLVPPCTLKKWYNGYGGTTDRIPLYLEEVV
jgi:hypothetical protein